MKFDFLVLVLVLNFNRLKSGGLEIIEICTMFNSNSYLRLSGKLLNILELGWTYINYTNFFSIYILHTKEVYPI